jgi:ABC-type branched-subunit amino acid transport system substrate-binding protein
LFNSRNSGIRSSLRGRTTLALSVGIASVLAMSGCAAGTPAATPSAVTYKIGVLMDLSKTYAFIGQPALAGLRTAVVEVNKAGGVGGHMLELIVKDDRSDAATGRTAFQELAAAGVVAIVGPNASATLTPLAPLAGQLKVPNISLAAVSTIQGTGAPFLYAAGLHVAESALIDAAWMVKDGAKSPKVAGLSLNTPSVAEFRSSLDKVVPSMGGTLVANAVVAVDATDMTNAALPIATAKPDYVAVGLLATQLPGVVKSLRDRGSQAKVINYFVASDDSAFEAVNDEGFFAVRHFAAPTETDNPAVVKMAAAAVAAGQTADLTSGYFTFGYVVGNLLSYALGKCGEGCNAAKLDTALSAVKSFDTKGLSGPLGVTDKDHFFVKYGKVFGWNKTKKATYAVTDWITSAK